MFGNKIIDEGLYGVIRFETPVMIFKNLRALKLLNILTIKI
jgi:hypothetical protein